jgi:hypothetical protein
LAKHTKAFEKSRAFFLWGWADLCYLYYLKFQKKMAIPWAQLIPHAISLAEMAGGILSSNKKAKATSENNPNFDATSLMKRIEVLENNELKQAELIQQMAQQNVALIEKVEKSEIKQTQLLQKMEQQNSTLVKKVDTNFRLAVVGICISLLAIGLALSFIF